MDLARLCSARLQSCSSWPQPLRPSALPCTYTQCAPSFAATRLSVQHKVHGTANQTRLEQKYVWQFVHQDIPHHTNEACLAVFPVGNLHRLAHMVSNLSE